MAVPESLELQKILLLGAMYIEESEILQALDENEISELPAPEVKQIILHAFCSTDMNASDVDSKMVAGLLRDDWQIETKQELAQWLEFLLEGYSHQQFEMILKFAQTKPVGTLRDFLESQLAGEDFSDLEEADFKLLMQSSLDVAKSDGPKTLIAWDWARYVHIVRLSYLAKIISFDEALQYLEKLKEPVTGEFGSWKEYATSYKKGRLFWSGPDDSLIEASDRLLFHPLSPWNRWGWF